MKQTLFETKERANELLKEAIDIWRQSEHSESLEGLEQDPVFTLLINAIAYQENENDSEIQRLRQEILEDFTRLLTPYEVGHAIPASVVVQAFPIDSMSEVKIDGNTEFNLNSKFSFIPLFRSKVFNVKDIILERIDGRRWKVSLDFKYPVKNLSGFSFAIKDCIFKSLSVKVKGARTHLIKPWNLTELPFSQYFNPDSLTYNHGEYYSGSMLPMDIFVSQNIRMFWIDDLELTDQEKEYSKIEMIFEFNGIVEDFKFDSDNISINTVFLVDATVREVTISSQTPIVRLAGYSDKNINDRSQQFLHLIKPLSDQIYYNTEFEVRKVTGDRFNQAALIKLLNSIVNKYHTDFYAFQNMDEMKSDRLIYNLQELLARLIKISHKDSLRNMAGVYLLLHDKSRMKDNSFSVNLKYLTTSGSLVNKELNKNSKFITKGNLKDESIKVISTPIPGLDEINSETIAKSLLKYYMVTGDRIVTPADIKLFCLTELQRRYSIGEEIVKSINIAPRPTRENFGPGYEICVDISLSGSNMVKRSLSGKIPFLEFVLQKMIEVRSTGIYPVRVNMIIEESL